MIGQMYLNTGWASATTMEERLEYEYTADDIAEILGPNKLKVITYAQECEFVNSTEIITYNMAMGEYARL